MPKINEHQVILLIADSNTGIVLDMNLNAIISQDQIKFKVFESKVDAKDFFSSLKIKKIDLEGILYDSNEKVIEVI